MCRSIKRLRDGTNVGTDDDVRAASRQFVRKVTGFQHPTTKHQAAFEHAIDEISHTVEHLLADIVANLPAAS